MILVCGGAGYIGSHAVRQLIDKGEDVVIVDNLETGHKDAIHPKAKFYKVDIRNEQELNKVFEENDIDVVVHFAANSLVGESMTNPLKYFNNNVHGTEVLLKVMIKNGVKKIVFSSTAATYGEPKQIPILETDQTCPTNAYGETKLCMEKMMKWQSQATDMTYVALRYFNVAGAKDDGSIGEAHKNETHLIPIILQTALGQREFITIYGDDYHTPDGTCIRDYIDMEDLIEAHIKALEYLKAGGQSDQFNLGSSKGYSNLEVLETARKVTGKEIPSQMGERRAGDPDELVADSTKAGEILGWKAQNDLEHIITNAWKWHQSHPDGYKK